MDSGKVLKALGYSTILVVAEEGKDIMGVFFEAVAREAREFGVSDVEKRSDALDASLLLIIDNAATSIGYEWTDVYVDGGEQLRLCPAGLSVAWE